MIITFRHYPAELDALATGRYPGELEDLVARALDAGLRAIAPRQRRRTTRRAR